MIAIERIWIIFVIEQVMTGNYIKAAECNNRMWQFTKRILQQC